MRFLLTLSALFLVLGVLSGCEDEEMQMQKADGSFVWVSLTVDPIIDLDNDIIESNSMVVDLTRRKKAEDDQERLIKDL